MSDRSFIVHLTSQNATSYVNGNSNNAVYALPNIDVNEENEIWISVAHFICPYSWYNVSSDNNTLILYIQDKNYTFTIPEANYNGITLASQIQSVVNAYTDPSHLFIPIVNFSCSFDLATSKLTLKNNYYFYINSSSSILNVLGFTQQTEATLLLTTYTLTSTNPINLVPHHCICISMPEIETENIHIGVSLYNKTVICSIPVDVQPMGMIIYKPTDMHRISTNKTSINSLQIKLINQNGDLINLNGQHYTLALLFEIVKFTE
jgi:hypothetical protein